MWSERWTLWCWTSEWSYPHIWFLDSFCWCCGTRNRRGHVSHASMWRRERNKWLDKRVSKENYFWVQAASLLKSFKGSILMRLLLQRHILVHSYVLQLFRLIEAFCFSARSMLRVRDRQSVIAWLSSLAIDFALNLIFLQLFLRYLLYWQITAEPVSV